MRVKITERTLDGLEARRAREGIAQVVAWDEEQPGFGVVVGATATTYVVNYRREGKLERRKIGRRGEVSKEWNNHELNATIARKRARVMLGLAGDGEDPKPRKTNDGPTLREALAYHVGRMERGENRRGKVCSPRSIATLRGGVELHLAEWLDRPLVDLTADALDDVRAAIEREAERVAGSNPKNPPGRAVANRLIANVSAIWRSWHKRHGLPIANPVERLTPGALAARENRIANADLPDWYARVTGMDNHVRRDLQLVALFTGVRTDGVRNLRWEDVDLDEDLIHITRAKGDRPYTLPVVATVREILERRREDNAKLFAPHGGDHGFVFPSLSLDLSTVIAVAEVKERRAKRDARGEVVRDDDGNVVRETYLPGVQASRKTYNSVAMEIGIAQETRERLTNHNGRGVNVRHYGFPEAWDHLRACAEQIEAAIWERIKNGDKLGRKRKSRTLRSVA